MKDYWSWLGPLIVAILIGFAQVYSLIDRVNVIEERNRTEGTQALKELNDLKNRVQIIEAYCCGDDLK